MIGIQKTALILFTASIASIGSVTHADEAPPSVFFETHATNLGRDNSRAELILREIPRQTFIVALEEELDHPPQLRDSTLEPGAHAAANDIPIDIATSVEIDGDDVLLNASLFVEHQPRNSASLNLKHDEVHTVDNEDLCLQSDELIHKKWLKLAATRLSATVKLSLYDASLPVPENVEQLLNTIEFHHAFLAARALHIAIAKDGESPARLAALVRAYAHLGESTRHLFNGQSSAFFARSMVYAHRLTLHAPELADTYYARAYGEALFTRMSDASADLKKADELAEKNKTDKPAWAELIRSLIDFNTPKLEELSTGSQQALASYFAFMTNESTPLRTLTINSARAAIQYNPGAVRVESTITEVGGVSTRHQTTVESPRMLNRMTAKLAEEADVPAVREATKTALLMQFSQSAILNLRIAIEQQPRVAGELLPWSTYAAFMRECEFIDAFRRVYFVNSMLGADAKDESIAWQPLVEDHRYLPLEQLTWARGESIPRDKVGRIAILDFKDDVYRSEDIHRLLTTAGLKDCPRLHVSWFNRQINQTDRTAHDEAMHLGAYLTYTGPDLNFLREYLNRLEKVAPNHPMAITMRAKIDPDSVFATIGELEEKYGKNATAKFALAKVYASHGESKQAIELFKDVTKVAPEMAAYHPLADLYLAAKDDEKWQQTWDAFISDGVDYALDRSQAGRIVADHLYEKGRFKVALPYAKIAGDCYSSWGLTTYAKVLSANGDQEKAAELYKADFEQYRRPEQFYRFVRTTGHGDRQMAAEAYAAWGDKYFNGMQPEQKVDYVVYLLGENQIEKADNILNDLLQKSPMRFFAILMSVRALENNDTAGALAVLKKASANPPLPAGKNYVLCVNEMRRCLADPEALPEKPGKMAEFWDDPQAASTRGNAAYALGRICELRNKPEDAKWWYHEALSARSGDFTYRLLVADGLRRLGEQPFK